MVRWFVSDAAANWKVNELLAQTANGPCVGKNSVSEKDPNTNWASALS